MGTFQIILGVLQSALTPVPYRPPNWGIQPQLYSLTCTLPAPSPNSTTDNNTSSSPSPASQSPTTYYFDAVLRVEHSQELTLTKHPVQIGPAIVDHAYLQPARIVLEVGMSDALAAYQNGQYSSNVSKSVSAYKTFKQIQAARVPVQLTTRYDTYQNMAITDVRGTEDLRTRMGFRGSLYFEQIISANVSQTTTSVRPDTTGATNEGTKSTSPPSVNSVNGVDNIPAPQP